MDDQTPRVNRKSASGPGGPLRDHLENLKTRAMTEKLTLQDVFDVLGSEGHYVLILFMTLPFLQPIPLIGLSTPLGLLISLVAVFAFLNRPPWIPRRWARKSLSAKFLKALSSGAVRAFARLSRVLHPRWEVFFSGAARPVNLVLMVVSGVLLALPLPIPLSNTIPAWTLLFQALGQSERDGLFIFLSYICFVVSLTYFLLIGKGVAISIDSLGF